ncbi:MAG: tRNA uridine(34) 5-carboxymethylaminomethyl modification radical SAM/GNAT enzyme Elp3, partial [Chloroflexota bacterium]
RRGTKCQCIRCKEIRRQAVKLQDLVLDDLVYHAAYTEEHFLSYNTPQDQLAGYLRLSLPDKDNLLGLADLSGAAIIREVHIYGQSLGVGAAQDGAAQHIGLGTHLIERAEIITREKGFPRLAVIAAVGTRQYYAARGFIMGDLYMVKDL